MTGLAWAGGFFDGEGTVNLYLNRTSGRSPYWQRQVSVGNTHRESIVHFAEIVGVGKIYSRPSRSERHKPFFVWVAGGPMGDEAIEVLLPHLFTKREQAELMLQVGPLLARPRFTPVPEEAFAAVEQIMLRIRQLNGNQKSGRTFKRPTKAVLLDA